MRTYSTKEAAETLNIHWATLYGYIADGKIKAPKLRLVGSVAARVWTAKDIEKVRKQLPKIANGRRKKKRKK